MHKRDLRPASPDPRFAIDETGSLCLQVSQGVLDIGHGVSDMVETFTILGQELPDRGFIPQRLQELNERTTDRDHCLFDSLGLDLLPVDGACPVARLVALESQVQVPHGNGDVVKIQQLHGATVLATLGAVTRSEVPSPVL